MASTSASNVVIENIYQFKIVLKKTKPPIWRRIQVQESYNFGDLHVAIQNAMGWNDSHLHQFDVINPETGVLDSIGSPSEDDFVQIIPEDTAQIAGYFQAPKDKARYVYDFGDNWEHQITLEKIPPEDPESMYPKCIAGKRACPPDDAGGVGGYENLLQIAANPNHPEYEETVDWLGKDFDPVKFDPKTVRICNIS